MEVKVDSSGVRLLLYAVILLNIYVTRLVIKDDYLNSTQKILQALIVWLIPALGAVMIWIAYRAMQKTLEASASHNKSTLSYGGYGSSEIAKDDSGGE